MTIRGLIFDFDGLILDTETPEYTAWKEIFQKYHLQFPADKYLSTIGATPDNRGPFEYLKEQISNPIDFVEIEKHLHKRFNKLLQDEEIRPGVLGFINLVKSKGLKLGVASSASNNWVYGNLERLDLIHYFDSINTWDDVKEIKPDPELFILTMKQLKIKPRETIIFEDSPNGIEAAKQANAYCVAIPNPITQKLDLSKADLIMKSFNDHTLEDLLLMFA